MSSGAPSARARPGKGPYRGRGPRRAVFVFLMVPVCCLAGANKKPGWSSVSPVRGWRCLKRAPAPLPPRPRAGPRSPRSPIHRAVGPWAPRTAAPVSNFDPSISRWAPAVPRLGAAPVTIASSLLLGRVADSSGFPLGFQHFSARLGGGGCCAAPRRRLWPLTYRSPIKLQSSCNFSILTGRLPLKRSSIVKLLNSVPTLVTSRIFCHILMFLSDNRCIHTNNTM